MIITYKGKFKYKLELYDDIIRKCLLDTKEVFAQDSIYVMYSKLGPTHTFINDIAYAKEQYRFMHLEKCMTCDFFGSIPHERASMTQNFHALGK